MEIFFISIILIFAFGLPLWQLISENHKLSSELYKLKIEYHSLESRFKVCNELRDGMSKMDKEKISKLELRNEEMARAWEVYDNGM